MPTIKIYKYMKELDLKKEFFFQLFWRLAAMALGAMAAFYFGSPYFSLCIFSFGAYSFFHHFFQSRDLYQLRSEYKHSDLSPEEALEEYQTEMCMIHFENSENRVWGRFALGVTILPLILPSVWLLCCTLPIFLSWYEYKNSEFIKER